MCVCTTLCEYIVPRAINNTLTILSRILCICRGLQRGVEIASYLQQYNSIVKVDFKLC